MRSCEHCGASYEPSNIDQAYCTPAHSKAAYKKRKADRDLLEVWTHGPVCPTPHKKGYNSFEHAALFNHPTQEPYHCPCGAVHKRTKTEFKGGKVKA